MAAILTRFIVIKSFDDDGRYAQYNAVDGTVAMAEESVFSTLVKIEVERATINDRYVHLRFCSSNRYWRRNTADNRIVAQSTKPVEDTMDPSCTLFEPITTEPGTGVFYLSHVQTRGRAVADATTSFNFYLKPLELSDGRLRFLNWDTLVHLPRHVAFKGYNNSYLKGIWAEGHPYLQFASDDPNDEIAGHRVDLMADGHVRIYSVLFGRYWRYSNDWIWADSADDSPNDPRTLFWPVKIDDNTIALRSVGNNKFCKSHAWDGKNRCLNAAVPTIVNEARMSVEELVLNRKIYNVKYRMEDARIFGETPYSAGTTTGTNNSDVDSQVAVAITLMPDSALAAPKEKRLSGRQWFESGRASAKGAAAAAEEDEEIDEDIDFDDDDFEVDEDDMLEHYLAEKTES